ncbi:hypothetical protein AB0M47_11160 [Hamadaea sp. NPDC051192]|uniref:hypothetical protein n=1 Tax=Hamadaea sp. NPDC051192 TaxID=3154940 RepID=UPI003422FA40
MLAEFLSDNNFGDTRSGGLAGPMGLLLIVVLGIAIVLLIRNMSKRIKRLPASFDGEPAEGSPVRELRYEKSSSSADLVEEVEPGRDNSR